jgi:O-antigen/teichoic acid export membrane protein
MLLTVPLSNLFNLDPDWKLMLLIPLHAYFTSYNSLMFQWISRKRKFVLMTRIRFLQGLLNIIVSFIAGYYLEWGHWGLIIANFASVAVSNIVIDRIMNASLFSGFIFRKSFLRKYIMRYRNFAYYSTPLSILNFSTANILSYIIQVSYGSVATGLYTNASRLINTPLSIISSSYSAVFYQHFSRSEKKQKVMTGSFLLLVLIFTSLLLPLVIWGKPLIVWYLGSTWEQSADFQDTGTCHNNVIQREQHQHFVFLLAKGKNCIGLADPVLIGCAYPFQLFQE